MQLKIVLSSSAKLMSLIMILERLLQQLLQATVNCGLRRMHW
uniref:Uncharacterized protein n=1 Tax=Arundo donax TaxID=35708 RepID=A0A0A9FXU6_ARUDO